MGNGTFVGLDVHARSVVAGLIDEATGEVRVRAGPARARESWWAGSGRWPGPVRVAYEAGPTGYGLARALRGGGHRVPGGGAEPDPARARRSGSRTIAATPSGWRACCGRASSSAVRVPDPADEAARDLVRAREDARADLMRARHRLSKMLLRHGRVYDAAGPGRGAHDAWLRRQRLDRARRPGGLRSTTTTPPCRPALRRDRLDDAIAELAARAGSGAAGGAPVVPARGGHAHRRRPGGRDRRLASPVAAPRSAPIWASPRASPSRAPATPAGPITKTGNAHARRLLVEAAWHHRRRAARERRPRAPARGPAARGARPRRGGRACAFTGAGASLESRRGPALDDRGGGRRARAGGLVLEPCRDGRLAPGQSLGQESAPDGRLTPREAMRD